MFSGVQTVLNSVSTVFGNGGGFEVTKIGLFELFLLSCFGIACLCGLIATYFILTRLI